jgi:hypothetical protein
LSNAVEEFVMQGFGKFLAVLALVGFCGVSFAADKPAAGAKKAGLRGEVVSVDGTNVKIKTKDGEVTVATDASTAVQIEGKEGKVADLKAGQKVMVTPETGTATKIVVGGGGGKKAAK